MGSTSENIKAIASVAGLTPDQQEILNGYTKALDTHQKLTALPSDVAKKEYAQLTPEQQKSLKDTFGEVQQKRGWLGTALHYTVEPVFKAVSFPVVGAFKVAGELSDLMTRAYRTAAISVDQGMDISKAWTTAKDNGDKVFSPSRIDEANKTFGADVMSVAMKVAGGMTLDQIMSTGTEAEKLIASRAAQKQDPLFDDALAAANAAKYSPGRFIANAILPRSMEGQGLAYKVISGVGDAAFRVFADPLLNLGKAKKAYDVGKYALDNILLNAANVEKAFQNPAVQRFDEVYTAALKTYADVQKAFKGGKVSQEELVGASIQLKRIAPEFGDDVIQTMIDNGVHTAGSMKNFLANSEDSLRILKGQSGRQVALLPRLNVARQARITALTAGNKLINFDAAGKRISREIFGDSVSPSDVERRLMEKTIMIDSRTGNIATSNTPKEFLQQATQGKIGAIENRTAKLKNDQGYRMPLQYVQDRIDRFASKFTRVPYFKDDFFDPNASDAAEKVYQLARLANTRYNSRLFAEAFKAGDEAQKRQIMIGVYNTIAEIRGLNKVPGGKNILDKLAASSREQLFAPRVLVRDAEGKPVIGPEGEQVFFEPSKFNNQQFAIFDYQLASGMSVPKISDLDKIVGRYQVASRIMGWSHKPWAESLTSAWSFLTLAGPRFAVRNSIEDLMIHMSIGESAWGVAAGKRLSTKIRLGQGSSLGVINKLVKRSDRALYASKLAEAKTIEDARQVMADAVMSDKYLGKLDPQAREVIAEMAKYGQIDDMLASVAEGGKKGLTGADHWTDAIRTVDKYGIAREYKVDGVTYSSQHGGNYREYSPIQTEGKIAWITSIGAAGNDPLGSIALRYMEKPEYAIQKIREFLTSDEYASQAKRFQLYNNAADAQEHARRVYIATRNLFVKNNGQLNKQLLAKVRVRTPDGGIRVNTRDLSIDDLPKSSAEAPEFVVGPTIMPIAEGNPAGKIVGKHWDWLGEMNARWTREPLVMSAAVDLRKAWKSSGLEERYIKLYTDPIRKNATLTAAEKDVLIKDAEEKVKKKIIEETQHLAKEHVLAYVDNPDVRSQLAFTMRNFARYYRASEDFYRRALRGVRYNPEALARLQLTYDGLTHSGFVQRDDQGEAYFIYPGMNEVYKVMGKLAKAFGINGMFTAPMPVEFGAKLNMITPSMNPDSAWPTFSGPLAALPIKAMYRLVPSLQESEKYLFGTYGEDQPIVNAILPAHINRLLSVMNKDERESQYASAFRKAVTYLEATGHGLQIKQDAQGNDIPPTPGELQDYLEKVKGTTSTILSMRFFSSLFLPASPMINVKSEMANWVRDNERTSFKQVFSNLVTEYNGDYDRAIQEWIKYYPKQMPYTISESKKRSVAVIKYGEAAGNWVDNNGGLLKKYPQAAAFLIPQIGKFNFDAYRTMFNEGFLDKKPIEDFLREVQVADDRQEYFAERKKYLETLKVTPSVERKRIVNKQWDAWSKEFMSLRPMLQTEFAMGAASDLRKQEAIKDLRNMFEQEKSLPNSKTARVIKQMLTTYDQFVANSSVITDRTATSELRLNALKETAKQNLQQIAAGNPNAISAYSVLFLPLIGE